MIAHSTGTEGRTIATVQLSLIALLIIGIAGAVAWRWHLSELHVSVSHNPPPLEPTDRTVRPSAEAEKIAESGKIMGVGLGSEMEEARERFDQLCEPEQTRADAERETDEKEEGERASWNLKDTEYSWIIAWTDEHGKIVRMRARLRPESAKPFAEIGDLATAVVNEPDTAAWTVTGADGWPFRIVAQGVDQRASTIYLFSLRPPNGRD